MGTSAMIGIYKENKVTASYCHYDGYVEGVGRTLVKSYNSQYDAEIVAKGGYLSSLSDDYVESKTNSVNSDAPIEYENVQHFMDQAANDSGAEYLYLWDGEAWFVYSVYGNPKAFEEVEINLKKVA